MRSRPVILHLDLDAFFAAVEQRDKPSLRGKPVVVGGTGPRGVVSTASYEARRYGIHSAMSGAEARRRCPGAAFLGPRFGAYRMASDIVMAALRELSPLVEPLSLDEAFVDLSAAGPAAGDLGPESVRRIAEQLRATIRDRTGLTASVGAGSSKLVAKIASDLEKPDGLLVIAPGEELAMLHALPVTRLWGVGPVTAQRLQRIGVATVAQLAAVPLEELVGLVGEAVGAGLAAQAAARDDRAVVPDRETKSVGAEETFDTDVADLSRLRAELDLMAGRTARRLRGSGHSGRTVTLKVRLHDFRTLSRSLTLPGATDDESTIRRVVRKLLGEIDVSDGIRLIGVTVSGLSDHVQDELPDLVPELALPPTVLPDRPPDPEPVRRWAPGSDVEHATYGRGWVQGSGVGRVTVRFETAHDLPGAVRTFATDHAELVPAEPAPYVPVP
ncbi:MAG: polymerase [Frankiales bacterium]|nr:polymerase [Frankiales bacterium]